MFQDLVKPVGGGGDSNNLLSGTTPATASVSSTLTIETGISKDKIKNFIWFAVPKDYSNRTMAIIYEADRDATMFSSIGVNVTLATRMNIGDAANTLQTIQSISNDGTITIITGTATSTGILNEGTWYLEYK